jgi:hypothetical protein
LMVSSYSMTEYLRCSIILQPTTEEGIDKYDIQTIYRDKHADFIVARCI